MVDTRRFNKWSSLEVKQTEGWGWGSEQGYPLHLCYIRFLVSLHTLRFRSIDFLAAHLDPVFGKIIHPSHHSWTTTKKSYSLIQIISYLKLNLWCKTLFPRPCWTTVIPHSLLFSESRKQLFWRKTFPWTYAVVSHFSSAPLPSLNCSSLCLGHWTEATTKQDGTHRPIRHPKRG